MSMVRTHPFQFLYCRETPNIIHFFMKRPVEVQGVFKITEGWGIETIVHRLDLTYDKRKCASEGGMNGDSDFKVQHKS